MNVLLEARGLHIGHPERPLIQDLHLRIEPGQCWVVLGPNGAGKSTLLRVLAGLAPPSGGEIHLQGAPLQTLNAHARARRLGLLLQQGNPGLHNRVLELVLAGGYARKRHWWDTQEEIATARAALDELGLAALAEQAAETLSGGELRRAEIARLLVQDPPLALLDEPLNHLDIGQQVTVMSLLRQRFVDARRALLLVAHDPGLARHIATHCLLLGGNGAWEAGPAVELVTAQHLAPLLGRALCEFDTPGGPLLAIDWAADQPGYVTRRTTPER
ncbi:ABC transporter ATP-binding protein [endosymbiont of unidentified scaly snail isolate Monju]|uniref:ABC transporter ATP-binding protein n=1 Tax=endosymbiont of unidentified scaly snail isolate Monju TaxID=1248727 RepID=UPI0003892130|nr:ABC transporter ATP-binding protein [endosymbiont of unidentified scaly snail isolate Monju]BAN68439.1 iron complex ABC transporter ATP-binding protein [endosymbiont of unidentified scaly snail isolate Monju]